MQVLQDILHHLRHVIVTFRLCVYDSSTPDLKMLNQTIQYLIKITDDQAVRLVIRRGVDCSQILQDLSELPVPA